jgi:hypothetical protein
MTLKRNHKYAEDLHRRVNTFKKRYHTRNVLVKGEKGNLLGDLFSILNEWRNYFPHLLKKGGLTFW